MRNILLAYFFPDLPTLTPLTANGHIIGQNHHARMMVNLTMMGFTSAAILLFVSALAYAFLPHSAPAIALVAMGVLQLGIGLFGLSILFRARWKSLHKPMSR